jgi:hypothetical protein
MNPYLKEFNKIRVKSIWRAVEDHHTVDEIFDNVRDLALTELRRKPLINKYSWSIPDARAIAICKRYSPLIEVGAGGGYWAKLITDAGGKITCYDNPEQDGYWWGSGLSSNKKWHRINATKDYCSAIRRNRDRTLFLCWPPKGKEDTFTVDCLNAYSGEHLIYVGEGAGGCTGSPAFHKLLNKTFEIKKIYRLASWHSISDCLFVYKRIR